MLRVHATWPRLAMVRQQTVLPRHTGRPVLFAAQFQWSVKRKPSAREWDRGAPRIPLRCLVLYAALRPLIVKYSHFAMEVLCAPPRCLRQEPFVVQCRRHVRLGQCAAVRVLHVLRLC
jgi:hypothetical protein